ncbi:DUF4190 domain-containing protein [Luteimonas yindakuii]|uniref:DUF4190 domain-containing protein n=1 Tax=Luteimonas yindakuii TaxID=2565782 RepID=A0A4Z1RBK8_9GAMM|nr:DUF4190 domain-containing protein [Luteimonas yindakuii]QCO67835.1 DUF4190 domain-containing protein [Luteimonas yindakuii]TKS54158.1 DUF4190 domain-containing protein [Luteimonas yindakuii]
MDAMPRQTSVLAVLSLVFGILGWTLLPGLGAIVAVVTGHIARAEIRRTPQTLEGDGLAIAGLVLGWLGIVLGIVLVALMLLVFGGLAWLSAWA